MTPGPHVLDYGRVLAAAKEDHGAVIELTRALVCIPTRAGIDPYDPIVDLLSGWMREHCLPTTLLRDGTGATVGLTIHGGHPGPRWVLDACPDTAPFGDETAWTHPPTSGVIEDGWLWGRGSSDSKAAVAIFCHLVTRLATARHNSMAAWCCCSTLMSTPAASAAPPAISKAPTWACHRDDDLVSGTTNL